MTAPSGAVGDSVTPGSESEDPGAVAGWPGVSWWDRFFLLRPILLLPVWTFFLLGSRSYRSVTGQGEWRLLPSFSELSGLALVGMVVGAAYVLNQVVDADVDRINRKLFIVPAGLISSRGALRQATLLVAIGLAGAIIWRSSIEVLLLVGVALLGAAYSVPPLRLKGRPLLDALAHTVGFGLLFFLLGWLAGGGALGWTPLVRAIPYAFAIGAVFLVSTLEDRTGDSALGLKTSARLLGGEGVRKVALSLAAAVFPWALVVDEWPAVVWAGIMIPLYAYLWRRGGVEKGFWVNQTAGRIMLLTAVPGCVSLLGAAGVFYLLARYYYRRRFGLVYPRFHLSPRRAGGH